MNSIVVRVWYAKSVLYIVLCSMIEEMSLFAVTLNFWGWFLKEILNVSADTTFACRKFHALTVLFVLKFWCLTVRVVSVSMSL